MTITVPQYQGLDGIVQQIQGLNLRGIDSSRIMSQAVATDDSKLVPFISVSIYGPETMPLDQGGGGNTADNYEFRYLVAIFAAKAEEETMLPLILEWRQQIIDAFHMRRVSPLQGVVSGLEYTKVEPMAVFDRNAWLNFDLAISCFRIVSVVQRVRT